MDIAEEKYTSIGLITIPRSYTFRDMFKTKKEAMSVGKMLESSGEKAFLYHNKNSGNWLVYTK